MPNSDTYPHFNHYQYIPSRNINQNLPLNPNPKKGGTTGFNPNKANHHSEK